jgi:hypothetical protein
MAGFAQLLTLIVSCMAMTIAASADEIRSYQKQATFDDVKFDLNNAIISRGFAIDFTGNIGNMLERTGPDVGSTKPIYKNAEFVGFCSAKLSRASMEADPANIGSCPYVIFIYEAAAKPGEVVVGYRRPVARGNDASLQALAQIDVLLDDIVKEAAK